MVYNNIICCEFNVTKFWLKIIVFLNVKCKNEDDGVQN